MTGLLIREGPATELTVAARILAHFGALAPDARVAFVVGSDVVYLAGRGIAAATMTPYDVCAVLLRDGSVLAGSAPDDAERYLGALRAAPGARVAAAARGGELLTTPDLAALVTGLVKLPWTDAEGEARAAGALVGAYPFPEA